MIEGRSIKNGKKNKVVSNLKILIWDKKKSFRGI